MPSLGELSVRIGAKTEGLDRGVDQSKSKLRGLAGEMRSVINTAGKLGVAAGAAGAAILTGLVASGLKAIDTNAKLARSLEGTIDGVRGLQIAAGDAGIADLEGSLNRLNRRLGAVEQGGGPAVEAVKALNLNLRELRSMDVDERLATIADAVRDFSGSTQEAARHLQNLGFEQKEAIGFFRAGGDAIRAARREVDEYGLSVSQVDAAKVEQANDAMQRIGRTAEVIRTALAVKLAPILTEIADRFNAIVRENQGFRDTIETIIERGIRGFGKFLDVLQGLRVSFKAVELVATGFGAAAMSVVQLAAEGISRLVDAVNSQVNLIIRALNRLPNVAIAEFEPFTDSAYMQGLREFADEARNKVGEVRGELHDLAMQEMPSAKFERFLEAARDRANETAEALARVDEELRGAGGAEAFGVDTSGEDEAAENDRRKHEAALERLRERVMSEAEILAKRHAEELEELASHHEAKRLLDEEFFELRRALEEKHLEEMQALRERAMTDAERFEAMSLRGRISTMVSGLAKMTAGVAQHNEKMFKLNQAAALAEAAVSLPSAILKSWENAGGYPWGIAPAAAMAATGAAQIQAIRSASFAGGGQGVAPSATGTTAAPPVSDVGGGGGIGSRTFRVQGLDEGSIFSGKAIRRLLEELQEAQSDGARLVFE
ncbi:MAG TPA: hypothetical protein VK116_09405 [Planctomycetota bacterium]|nr:hypothetical protein [Planctomycetota bacterium]